MEKQKIPILMYHSIASPNKNEVMRSLHVKPESFLTQMRIIKALGYRGCSVSECMNAFAKGSNEKLIGLTFDDGYKNFYTKALPVLLHFGFTATVYVVSGLVGKSNIWDKHNRISDNPLMTWGELQDTLHKKIEIGCHSMTHKSLTDQIDLNKEVRSAKSLLESKLSTPITSFCYPYGHCNERTVQEIERTGFSSATTMIRSRAAATDNQLLLPRIPVTWHTLPHLFVIKLLTGYEDRRREC